MTNIVTNPILRERAKETTHRNLLRLFLMEVIFHAITFAVVLIPFLLSLKSLAAMRFMNGAAILRTLATPTAAAILLAYLLSPLSAGLFKAHIDMTAGRTPSYGTLFSLFPHFLGCIGLNLLITLKMLLWTLPSFGILLVLGIIGGASRSDFIMSIAPLVMMIVLFACILPAALRYSMALYFYADCPEDGVLSAMDKSRGVMQYRKWQLFKLPFIYMLIDYIVTSVCEWLPDKITAIFSNPQLGSMVGTILSLAAILATAYLTIRTEMCRAHFFEEYKY